MNIITSYDGCRIVGVGVSFKCYKFRICSSYLIAKLFSLASNTQTSIMYSELEMSVNPNVSIWAPGQAVIGRNLYPVKADTVRNTELL